MAPWKSRRPIYLEPDSRVSSLYAVEPQDARLVNEVFGFVVLAATTATRVGVELIVTDEQAVQLAGADRAPVLLTAAVDAGFMERLSDGTHRLIERRSFRWHKRPESMRGPGRYVW